MDMYRILENFDAVNSKQTLTEGRMKDMLHKKADSMSKEEFVADAGEYGMQPEEAVEFWIAVNGDDEELDEERRSEEDWDAQAIAQQKAKLAREKQKIMMQRKISGQDSGEPPVVRDMSEADMEEGNRFTGNLAKARAAGKKQADLDGDGDMEKVQEDDMSESFTIQRGDKFLLGGQSWVSREEAEKQKFLLYRHKSMAQQVLNKIGKPGDKIVAIGQPSVAEAGKALFPGTPEYELRFGKDDASSAFDKKKISTGTVYSRRYKDEPESDDDAPKSAGRPKGTGRKLGAKGPSVASKLLKGKGGLKEHDHEHDHEHGMDMHMHNDLDSGEYDQEGDMAQQDLHTVVDAARELHAILGSDENLPEWVQSKITKALDYIDTARDYVKSSHAERGEEEIDEGPPPGGFKPGDRVTVDGQKGPTGSTTGVYVTQLLTRSDQQPAYAFRFDDKQYPKNTYDTVAHNLIFPAGVSEATDDTGFDSMMGTMQANVGLSKNVMEEFLTIYYGALDGEDMTDNIIDELGDHFSQVRRSKDPILKKCYKAVRELADDEIDAQLKGTLQAIRTMLGDPAYTPPPKPPLTADDLAWVDRLVNAMTGHLASHGIKAHPNWLNKEPGNNKEPGVSEADYSAKSARAGKDIGKPGKNFSKIAKGAAERYGSKAAGERVAGAVLNKLRAKEGVEEESSDKKDPPFTPDTKSSFKKSNNPNRTNRDSVKALAQKGLADMTTADLKAELKRRSQVEEESTETKDQHAEKAGKKVTRDIEHDEGHKGRDDAKAEKAGKKVTRDIEYDDKKDKKKEVEETTVSGSVAPAAGGDAPKKGKGGMQFGKGVYEGQVAESFEKQLKNVLNEGMSVNVSTDDTGKKSISVNATDADADALGDMLKMAGLFSSEGYSRACTNCGGIHEAGACGADMVEEELANSPNEVYTDADYMTQTLSGGLNGPKTTGQTTGAVVNRQDSRQGVMAETERVKEQAESRLWNLYKKI